jgi:pilus assembly protein CpaB
MRFIGMAVLALGLLLAGGAVYFARDYYSQYQAMLASQMPAAPETVRVVAAEKPLKYGDRIDLAFAETNLKWVTWPKDAVPEGAFTTAEELLGEEKKLTRTVLRTIEPGELVLKSKLTGFGESARVATQVSDGMRAVTISIDAVSGVAGLIAPGDRVDILLTRTIQEKLVTSIILQDVPVIATDQDANADGKRAGVARTATVEVDPTDASKLALAQQVGRLSLTLRGVSEDATTKVEPVSIEDLPAQPQAAPAPAPAPAPVVEEATIVRVRKGAEITDVRVE